MLVVGGSLLVALLWISLFYHLHQVRESALGQARRDATNLSIALASQVSRVMDGINQVMQLMQEDFRRDPGRFDLDAWTSRVAALHLMSSQIATFDQKGDLLASQMKPASGVSAVNIADRSYFTYLASHPDAGLLVDRTLLSRLRNRRMLQIARRLSAPDGSFRGVIVAGLDPEYFARQFEALNIGAKGSVAVLGLDGYMRARSPFTTPMYDHDMTRDLNHAGVFEQLKSSPQGTYQLKSVFDGEVRVFGYRLLDALPLVLVVGKSLREILAPVQLERDRTFAAGTVTTLAIVGFLLVLGWEFRRREIRERLLFATERALREAEVVFRGLFESSTDMLCVHRLGEDGAVRLDIFNKAAAAARALDAKSVGRRIEDLLPTPVAAAALDHIAQVVETGEPLRTQGSKSGEEGRYYETVIVPLFEEEAERRVTRVFVSIRDITHLREIEQAIVRSETRYRLLAETTSDVVTRLSLDFKREYISPACRILFGYEPEEMLGGVPSDAMHPEDAPRVRGLASQLVAGEIPNHRLTYTYRSRHKLGHWVWIEASITLAHDEVTGAPYALICALRDVTQRREAEAAIRASEMRFRLLAENTSETIMLVHENGRRSYVSPACERLLGYTPAELETESLGRFVHPEYLEELKESVRQLAGTAMETSITLRAQHRNGSWIWIEAVLRRILEAQGDDPTVVVTLRDISERRAQSDALQKAKSEAENASQAKSDFLASMSHEIRTPLNGILGFTDLLLGDAGFTGEHRRSVERIQTAGSALRSVVDDILDFSKIEAGHVDLEALPFNPSALADSVVSIVRGNIGPKVLTIRIEIDARVPGTLVGDADRLRQILLNLLNNAVKFTPAGTIVLSARCRRIQDGAAHLRFAVADTGIGIPEDKRSRLFERFSQVDGSIRREYGGTGLGLAISKSLVEAMGGTIGVEHAVPHGSTFWIDLTLPLGDAMATRGRGEASIAPAAHPASILLVEDHEINQELARAVLQAAGHRVDVAGNGAEAVRAVQVRPYEIILMDVQMPIMDGLSATRHIRQLAAPARDIPIVAMSANVLPAQIADFRRAGMDDHVGKPFRQRDLLATVQKWTAPGARSPAAPDPPLEAVDVKTHRELQDLIGAPKVRSSRLKVFGLLDGLVSQMREPCDRAKLAGEAHALIAATGMLGFSELTALMRRLEQCCKGAGEAGETFATLGETIRSARRSAVTALEQLDAMV